MKNIDKLFDFTTVIILTLLLIPIDQNTMAQATDAWNATFFSGVETVDLTEKPQPIMPVGQELSTVGTYCNDRFDFCMAYPADILIPVAAGDNSDGKVFASEDDQIHVWVYGTHSLNWTLADEYNRITNELEALSDDAEHDSKKKTLLADDYFVVHRWLDDQQYYQKTFLREEQFITISFQASFDPTQGELIQDVRQKVVGSITL